MSWPRLTSSVRCTGIRALAYLASVLLLFLANSAPAEANTQRVSVATDGTQGNSDFFSGYSDSGTPPDLSISSDGRYVAFGSGASNLVPNDTNGVADVFVHDRQTGATERVSVASDGAEALTMFGVGGSYEPSISADGRYIAFTSYAWNLVPNDTNGNVVPTDVFIHDRLTGATQRVSVATNGTEPNGVSFDPSISADGRYVAFASKATNLAPSDAGYTDDIFVHDVQTGVTAHVDRPPTPGHYVNGMNDPAISANGRYVAFLFRDDTPYDNSAPDVFVLDRQTGEYDRISGTPSGIEDANVGAANPAISADGRYVAFSSGDSLLVAGDTNGSFGSHDVFVYDRVAKSTDRVSVASDGTEANASHGSTAPSISGDGRFVTFSSEASNLVPGDTNSRSDIFIHDRQAGITERLSVASNGTQANGAVANGYAGGSISADGRFVAFSASASNLVPEDSNGASDVFVWSKGDGSPSDRDGDGVLDGYDQCPDVPAQTLTGCPPRPVTNYVALGDSVAAGEGINYGWEWQAGGPGSGHWYLSGNTEPWNAPYPDCHQSDRSYPWLVKMQLGFAIADLACTGSLALNGIFNPRSDGTGSFPPQPQLGGHGYGPPALAYDVSRPDVVSLTLGANDVHFKDVVTSCYKSLPDCNPNIDNDLLAERNGLRQTLEEIQSRGLQAGHVPLVVVTTYYNPFPRRYPDKPEDCVDLFPAPISVGSMWILTNTEVGTLVSALNRLNQNIRDVAAAFPNVVVVDPPSFAAHAWCTTEPWVHGPSLTLEPGQKENPAPFHPTPGGQAAIADRVIEAISNATVAQPGENVRVALPSGAELTFDKLTDSGAVTLAAGTNLPPADNHQRIIAFDLASAASYQGNIHLSIPSADPAILYHYENGAWRQVADSHWDGARVTGTVASLSPFALGIPAPMVQAQFQQVGASETPASISFDASASSVDGGGTLNYLWDFGDGTTGTGGNPTHVYEKSGAYPVKLRVVSEHGAEATATNTVAITNAPPVATIGGPAEATPGEPVSLSGAASFDPNGEVVQWLWDYGDSTEMAEGQDVQYSFSAPGVYTVTLRVLDDEGASDTATLTITVSTPAQPGPSDPGTTPTVQGSGLGLAPGVFDTSIPNTYFTKRPRKVLRTRKKYARATFRFRASESGVVFLCKIDRKSFQSCGSKLTRQFSLGSHVVEVKARAEAGNVDRTPARCSFRVEQLRGLRR
jgi:Tol biopolymer transport system component